MCSALAQGRRKPIRNAVVITGVNSASGQGQAVRCVNGTERIVHNEEALLLNSGMKTIAVRDRAECELEKIAVVLGLSEVVEGWNKDFFKNVIRDGAVGASPIEFPFTSPGALASRLSICCAVKGEMLTISSGPLSFIKALIYSVGIVSSAPSKKVIVAGVAPGRVITLFLHAVTDDYVITDGDVLIDAIIDKSNDVTIEPPCPAKMVESISRSFDVFLNSMLKTTGKGHAGKSEKKDGSTDVLLTDPGANTVGFTLKLKRGTRD